MESPIWIETLDEDERRLLAASDPPPKTADVSIIGAGMIGLATAFYLRAAGVRGICIMDCATALGEASGANAGGLWFTQLSEGIGWLAPLAQASSRLYDELAAQPGFAFDFRRTGLIELRPPGSGPVDGEELRRLEPALDGESHSAVFYPTEAQLNPAKLGVSLMRHLRKQGVKICLRCEIERLPGPVSAPTVVIAAGAWTPLVTRTLGWAPPIKPMRGQLLATVPRRPLLRHTVIGPQFYYWQLAEGHIAGGGTVEDVGFERGTNPAGLARIRAEMNALFPALRDVTTAAAWSGFRPYCEDERPVIGRIPGEERPYVAAGHFKKGIMLAPVTGKIIADLITTGKTDLPITALDAARFR